MKSILSKGLVGKNTTINYKNLSITPADSKESVDEKGIEMYASKARLIPIGKKDDELAVASVFLSSLKFIKEFRNEIFDMIKVSKANNIICLKEVSFPLLFADSDEKKKARFDGLVLLTNNKGDIKDAIIFEMKIGSNQLDENQLLLYLDMAKTLGIQKFVTISNQYVTSFTHSPLQSVKKYAEKKKIDLYHFTWDGLRILGVGLFRSSTGGIEDEDQLEIMGEINKYYSDCGAIKTFEKMSDCWKPLMREVGSGNFVPNTEIKKQISTIILDWIQQEKDLAFKLGDKLTDSEIIKVSCEKKTKQSIDERIKEDEKLLETEKILQSIYRIPNAVSPLEVTMDPTRKVIKQQFLVSYPEDGSIKAKLAFIRDFLKSAQKKSQEGFQFFSNYTNVLVITKGKNDDLKYKISDFLKPENVIIDKNAELKKVYIVSEIEIGQDFYSPVKSIAYEEKYVLDFYESIMQYFKKWIKPAPKVEVKNPVEVTENEIE
ncbi:hypothetical protein J6Y73_04430 [bacterium]|nr:hypothetical protein [bacterium]